MNDTIKINNLMDKVDMVYQVINNRKNYYDYKNSIKNINVTTTQDKNLKKLLNAHKIVFTIPGWGAKRIFTIGKIQAYEFFENRENQFDMELFKLLQIHVIFRNRMTLKYMGTMSHDGIMRINMKYENKEFIHTIAHELGHAWHIQFIDLLNLKYNDDLVIQMIETYLIELGTLKSHKKNQLFKNLKKLIYLNVSKYATKNIFECFAEIFALACNSKSKYSLKKYCAAKKAISTFNLEIKRRINQSLSTITPLSYSF